MGEVVEYVGRGGIVELGEYEVVIGVFDEGFYVGEVVCVFDEIVFLVVWDDVSGDFGWV